MRATMTSKGQVTIPKAIRDRLGLREGSVIDFEEVEGEVRLRVPEPEENPFLRFVGVAPTRGSTDDLLDELRGPVDIPRAHRRR